jgi:hypothetical protein
MKKKFAYVVNSRVVWLSDAVFHIPVLDDFYRIHLIENCQPIELENCTEYVVKLFNKFVQQELVHSPLISEDAKIEIQINYEKIKCFSRISEFIQCSLLTSLPSVFLEESDKIEVLAKSVINTNILENNEEIKHLDFISSLLQEKKTELKKRYLNIILQLKKARSLEEIKEVEYSLIYEGIHIA